MRCALTCPCLETDDVPAFKYQELAGTQEVVWRALSEFSIARLGADNGQRAAAGQRTLHRERDWRSVVLKRCGFQGLYCERSMPDRCNMEISGSAGRPGGGAEEFGQHVCPLLWFSSFSGVGRGRESLRCRCRQRLARTRPQPYLNLLWITDQSPPLIRILAMVIEGRGGEGAGRSVLLRRMCCSRRQGKKKNPNYGDD